MDRENRRRADPSAEGVVIAPIQAIPKETTERLELPMSPARFKDEL